MTNNQNNNSFKRQTAYFLDDGEYKKLVQTLKTDADYKYQRIKGLAAESHGDQLSQNPKLQKQYDRLLRFKKACSTA